MESLTLALGSAVWLGLLTSISPCPLATNVAAVSFVARHLGDPRRAFLAGLLYALGRTVAYAALGIVLVKGLLAAPGLSQVLQKQLNLLLGPLLIVVGLVLLEWITFGAFGGRAGSGLQQRVQRMGVWGSALLGLVFALSFCPTSAALFFGSLLPLALRHESGLLLPAVYGLATGLPVLGFATLIALGANRLGQAFQRVTVFELWARRATGILFIGIGLWFSVTRIWL
ncbi:MAG: aromatic aminobenezylarsenical efflux permease ArsG family transporter [Candidatus Delongbacteria bacterium]